MTGTVFSKSVHATVSTRQEDYWTGIASTSDGVHDHTVLIEYHPMYVTADTDAIVITLTDEQQDLLDRDFGDTSVECKTVCRTGIASKSAEFTMWNPSLPAWCGGVLDVAVATLTFDSLGVNTEFANRVRLRHPDGTNYYLSLIIYTEFRVAVVAAPAPQLVVCPACGVCRRPSAAKLSELLC